MSQGKSNKMLVFIHIGVHSKPLPNLHYDPVKTPIFLKKEWIFNHYSGSYLEAKLESKRTLHPPPPHISSEFSLGVNALLNLPFIMAPCVATAGGQAGAGCDNYERPYLTDAPSN